ncbi:DASH family cryptochrome [uncultured Muriicola sp.]|uniref:DASH family cryptochrome n=1 Tax=uncultured Muriicola sp. TaxID=1583102 RepID=UPI0026371E58|nr:DASH family cryptochrome [uncultured Muriicola sp.]
MNTLVWFRNDLRVSDNQSLTLACKEKKVIAVYCLDPELLIEGPYGFRKMEKYRVKFLLESLKVLQDNLASLNISLLFYLKKPKEILPSLIEKHHIKQVYLQKEWTKNEVNELVQVKQQCPSGISFIESYDQFLFHPSDLPYAEVSNIPEVFTTFRKKCEKYSKVRPAISRPAAKPSENLLSDKTSVPNLSDLGFIPFNPHPHSAFPFEGGENAAMERIQEYFWDTRKLAFYKRTRNGLMGKDYSSKLSAWLANGSISARTIYWAIQEFENKVIKNQDTYWLVFELIWRDYFKYVSMKHGHKIFTLGGILNKSYDWGNSETTKLSWIHGTTKEPFVNANMIELAKTGWMSNRGRQNVASYWAKELKQDWRIGAAYFESILIDYDVHSNWGNWMYNSGVGNDPRDRKFNIKRQAELYDPAGKFQNLWLQDTLF